ncbi:hypothetical protein KDI_32810 [Dictyobacter arantiisoli]|uniref:Uncharacterized protein n=1 Tax=Dictyobacter arantiisoli TaxID=2014874 RepID=A0A5A5TEG2_9CHLR|nr:hypothetical protein KDI_32810 [Dictyobacter arantiisoli]
MEWKPWSPYWQWKKQALDRFLTLFSTRSSSQEKSEEDLTATLYQQIGQLKVELDWLKKAVLDWWSKRVCKNASYDLSYFVSLFVCMTFREKFML